MTPVSRWYSGVASCIMYHRIVPDNYEAPEFWPNGPLCVRVSEFESQIRWLSENHRIISAHKMVQELEQGDCRCPGLVVTFDDGYADNRELALPILEKYQVPATIFITTGFIDGEACLWWLELESILANLDHLRLSFESQNFYFDLSSRNKKLQAYHSLDQYLKGTNLKTQLRFMEAIRKLSSQRYSYTGAFLEWDQVRELDRHPLITIGAHTVNHPALSLLTEAEMEREIMESVHRLEKELGHTVDLFSYPFGDRGRCGEREFAFVERSPLRAGFTTRAAHIFENHRTHLGSLPRVAIVHNDDLKRLKWKLSGREAIIAQRGRRFVTS